MGVLKNPNNKMCDKCIVAKEILKKIVSGRDLKVAQLLVCLSLLGKEFHKMEALIWKAQSPFVTKCDFWIVSRALYVYPNGKEGTYLVWGVIVGKVI